MPREFGASGGYWRTALLWWSEAFPRTIRVRRTFDRRAFAAPEWFHHPRQTGTLTPKCRPEDFLSGARGIVSATQNRIRGRENSAELGREFNPSSEDRKSFHNRYLVWLGR